MTRNDATEIICIALHLKFKPDDPMETAQHAVRIAIALDALGLLTYATDPHLNPRPSATSQTQERSSPEHWASQRTRD